MSELTVHDKNSGIANGDPVVAVAVFEGRGTQATTLGTGFSNRSDLVNQLEFAAQHGSRTQNITEENAQIFHSCDKIDVLTIDSQIEIEKDAIFA